MNPRHRHESDDEAVWQGVMLEEQTKGQAREYHQLFVDTYPRAAEVYYTSVIRHLDDGEFPSALQGLEQFIADFFDRDPLMRMDMPGIRSILHPMLWALVAATELGIDPG